MIVALILSSVAALGSGISSYLSQDRTNKFNQQQYEDWKSYNTPANQMSRLSEAGLNPYQVSGLNNQLSQPFQIGANTGISEMLSGLSRSMFNSGSVAENSAIKRENLGIRRDEMIIKRDKLALDKEFLGLKRDMVDIARKKGDAQAALFWSSVDQKDLVNNYLRDTMPFRIGSARYDFLNAQQSYNFNEKMNPLKLSFYAPYMRSMINRNVASAALANRQASHLDWLEPFQLDTFNRNMALNWRKYYQGVNQFDKSLMYDYNRLKLSGMYYNLARRKWYSDVLFRGLENIRGFLPYGSKSYKKAAGGYPEVEWTEW